MQKHPDAGEVSPEGEGAEKGAEEASVWTPVHKEDALRILTKVYSRCRHPHFHIAYGYSLPLEWKPREIADELWFVPLKNLTEQLESGLSTHLPFDKDEVESILAPLREVLKAKESENKTFEDFATETRLRATIQKKLGDKAKDLPQEEYRIYLKKERAAQISNWVSNILKDIRGDRPGGAPLCKNR